MEKIILVAKVLSDANRVNILALLLRHNELCVCEICDTLQLSQPLVSRHLKQMKEANMICARQEGRWMLYSINTADQTELTRCCLHEVQTMLHHLPKLIACERMSVH